MWWMVSSLGFAHTVLLDKTISNYTAAAVIRNCWLKRAAQPSAWDPSQFKQGCRCNWFLLSLGLIRASHVHHSFFITSVGFGSDPAPHPGLCQSLHVALRTVGIPVVACSIGVAWRNNGHPIKMNWVEFAFFVPSLVLLLLLLHLFWRLIHPCCFCDNIPISFFFSL